MASKSAKMSFVAAKWKLLTDEEKSKWQYDAKEIQQANPAMLSTNERKKLVGKGKKNLIKEVCCDIFQLIKYGLQQ